HAHGFFPSSWTWCHVRFGSKADICSAKTACPLFPRKQTFAVQKAMSALPPKATSNAATGICGLANGPTHFQMKDNFKRIAVVLLDIGIIAFMLVSLFWNAPAFKTQENPEPRAG